MQEEKEEMELNKPYNFKLKGRAKEVFKMLEILAKTKPIETDPYWWVCRGKVIAQDKDLVANELSATDRLVMRRN